VILAEAASVPPGGQSGSGTGAAPTAPAADAAKAGGRGSPSTEIGEEHEVKVGEASEADDELSATVGNVGLGGRPRAAIEPGATRETPPLPPGRPSGQEEGAESRPPDPRPPRGRPPPRTVGGNPDSPGPGRGVGRRSMRAHSRRTPESDPGGRAATDRRAGVGETTSGAQLTARGGGVPSGATAGEGTCVDEGHGAAPDSPFPPKGSGAERG